jgi:integrase/recombinase XerD
MSTSPEATFDRNYARHLQHLTLKGLQPKTIEAYSRAIRRIGERFDHQIDALSEQQLLDYFTELVASHSWSSVKLDLYGLKFYYEHVLRRPWAMPGLIKPPRSQRLPDIATVDETQRIITRTRVLSYRVFFFTLYSLGLRLGEGLRLQVGDIDGARGRVHIRDAKGNQDRLVPLPRKRSAHPPLEAQDHAGLLSGLRGNNSSMRLFGQEGSFSRVSVSQAMGSMSFMRAVSSRD